MRTFIFATAVAATALAFPAIAEEPQPAATTAGQQAAVAVQASDDAQKACHYAYHEGQLLRVCSSPRDSASTRQSTRQNLREIQQRANQTSPPR
ncbi:MAG: hypothetical protein JO056_00125 [Alphaproteobacteria bacterium]|jgi:hypothetical protein|nr:hypothetical protein [Alphaproteobacteria bacterium]